MPTPLLSPMLIVFFTSNIIVKVMKFILKKKRTLFLKNVHCQSFEHFGGVWWVLSNNNFQFLNNISRISTYHFTYFHILFHPHVFPHIFSPTRISTKIFQQQFSIFKHMYQTAFISQKWSLPKFWTLYFSKMFIAKVYIT